MVLKFYMCFSYECAGELNIAAIYSVAAYYNFRLFTEAAVNLVNDGYWNQTFSSKYLKSINNNT